ncbi:MAG: lamin tail domain-containing protein, partial [Planctomycetes bacterium]|nr:lamin tail domain-containing protein [Planctomycetota bacterium]
MGPRRQRSEGPATFEPLEARLLLDGTPIISEFMADNKDAWVDQSGDASDWIEIYNPTDAAVNLLGWHLTDNVDDLDQWTFPAETLDPGEYLLVYASDTLAPPVAGQELHANFALEKSGGYLALTAPGGLLADVVSSYTYGEQETDISYGVPQDTNTQTVLPSGAPATALVPTAADDGLAWTARVYDDSGWVTGTTGVGYDRETRYRPLIGLTVSEMYGVTGSVYIRVPFDLSSAGEVASLTLRMKYDDGFVVFLNGEMVKSVNGWPLNQLHWNSQASGGHSDDLAEVFVDYDLSAEIGHLVTGTNVLAIQGLNYGVTSTDLVIVPELVAATTASSMGDPGFLVSASPGWANTNQTVAGFVGDTQFSVDRGFFDAGFQVAITCDTPESSIYYTTDGTAPSATHGTPYTAPLTISITTTLRAVAVRAGWQPSDVDTETYIFFDDILTQTRPPELPTIWGGAAADYDMDPDIVNSPAYSGVIRDALLAVPTMSIVMNPDDLFGAQGIYTNSKSEGLYWERAGSIEMILTDGSTAFQENCGVRIYGGVGREPSVGKHSFRILFKDIYGDTRLNYQLFEDSPVDNFNTFVLRANFNDAWPGSMGTSCQYIRDQWAAYAQLAMGDLSHHSNFVHLYVNGMYWGLYNPTERPDAAFLAEYEGGQMEEYDALNSGEAIDGDRGAWDTMVSIANGGLSGEAQYAAIQQYLDVTGLADYCLLNHYISNWDWDSHNWYAARKREDGAQYKMFSWDAEWSIYDGVLYNDYTGTNNGGMPSGLFNQLLANQEFKMLLADRVYKFCFNDGVLTTAGGQDLWMQLADEIDLAIVGESARWGDHNRSTPYTRADWLNQRNWVMNTWFPARTNILLGQYRTRGWYPSVDAAVFSKNGGMVPSTYGLTMTGAGTIYYTTDGSDPRVAGGGVSATAQAYTGPVEINGNMVVRARVLSGTTWSAIHDATFMLDSSLEIRVAEIMYNPAPPTVAEEAAGFTDNDDFQYLELVNIGDEAIDLGGMTLSEGITCTLATLSLAPGARAVVVRNEAAFLRRYGAGLSGLVAGTFEGKLGGEGDRIRLSSILGDPIQDFEYKDGWYGLTDGSGFSLVIRDPGQELALWGTKEGWRTSWETGGNPGAADAGYDPAAVVINEILAHQDVASGDWIEFHNTSALPVNLGGWYLSDDAVNLMKYRFAPGTILDGGAYMVLTETDNFGTTAPDAGRLTGFALSELGDDVFLTSVSAPGVLGGYREDEQFGATLNGMTLGRYIKSTGGKDFVAVMAPTPWGLNAAPVVGPVVINEVLYDPAGGGDEFIELLNLTGAAVPLHDAEPTPNPWMFTQGITYTFPTDASIPAYGYALVVPIDPAAFRATYGIAPGVPIYGPYTGVLDNAGETIELSFPGVPEAGTGFVPYVRADRVTYDDAYPWPDDVSGFALMRRVSGDYGNDVANWMTSTYGGTPGAENVGIDTTPPSVPEHLRAQGLSATSIQLEWDASSDPQSGVVGYRVYRGGVLLGETANTTFVDTGVVASTTYSYQVSVWNADGVVSAKCAPLVVRIFGIATVSTPNSQTVWVTFSEAVTASSTEVLSHYRVTHHGGTAEVPVTAVRLQTNYLTVELTLGAAMVGEIEYTVTINDVVAQTGIAIVPNSEADFGYYQPGSGTILRQYWLGIPGQDVSLLTADPDYPATPTGSEERALFEAPTGWADEYGARMVGYVHPPLSGQYVFWIAADDEAELWLSTDEDPTHKVLIAYVPSATNPREWTKYPANQQSAPITLSVGRRYYIEAIQKEAGGSDHLAVGWQLPGGALERPIPGNRLSPYSPPPPITVSMLGVDRNASETGPNPGAVWVNRVGDKTGPLTVTYTISGTATSADYAETLTGTIVIPAGVSFTVLTVTPVNDKEIEGSETVVLTLLDALGYKVGIRTVTITIADNDPEPIPTVSLVATDPAAAEAGLNPGTFTVSRVGDTTSALTVYYTVGGTAGTEDYSSVLTGSVVIGAGAASAPIVITPVDDGDDEPDETVTITLLADAGYAIDAGSDTVTIADNDLPTVSLVATDASAAEAGQNPGTFTVSR